LKKKLNLIIIIILISIVSISCKKGDNKGEIKLEEKEKAPKSLVSIAEEIDEILTSTSEIEKIIELTPLEFETLEVKEKDKKSEDENKDEKDKIAEENLNLKDEELLKKWNDIDKKIDKTHKDWNDYEIDAMRKAINPEKTNEFKKNLNLCTKAVEDRNTKDILDTGSKAILSLASFFELYKDEIKGDLSRIKYAAYQAYLVSETDIENAQKLLDSTGESITRLRQKLDKEKTKTLDKLAIAIEDMKKSLGEDNKKLLEIKRDIILDNIKLLEM